jgi:hypothetical protein
MRIGSRHDAGRLVALGSPGDDAVTVRLNFEQRHGGLLSRLAVASNARATLQQAVRLASRDGGLAV